MKKYLIITIILFLSLQLYSQRNAVVKYTDIYKPDVILKGVRSIYIEPFISLNPNTTNATTPVYLKNKLTKKIRMSYVSSNYPIHSQYTHTDWYIIVDDPKDADAIISGTYNAVTERDRTVNEQIKKYQVNSLLQSIFYNKDKESPNYKRPTGYKYNVPYVIRKYEYKNKVNMDISIKITNKKGEVLFEDSYSGSGNYVAPENCYGIPCKIPASKTIAGIEISIMSSFVANTTKKFLPSQNVKSLRLIDVKPSDRDLKKALRRNDFETTEDLYQATYLYKKVYEKEKSADAACNRALLLYVLGYYSEAEEWLKLSGNKKNGWMYNAIKFYEKLRIDLGAPLKERKIVYN